MTPLLVLVTGPPCGGKTTLATRLAGELQLPLIAKDFFKERLAASLGTGDRDWSRRLGRAASTLLYAGAGVAWALWWRIRFLRSAAKTYL